ncbi:NACHT domain-containing protein [Polaribacter cellanae]|uniref:Core-binding (CB) domain-containing protein n=1 Tax=Polaribacter cellanae TaxID=2818493 RepID=A0A975CL51_9FLAO|nr:AAA family ATPase [Polaribacter cellanae]QTE21112.1 hypothetical protein J3359_09640 [Polaribacter cellanae]
MIQEKDLKLFWNFLYGIDNLPIPKKGESHHGIAGHIAYATSYYQKNWNLDEQITSGKFNNKKVKGFIKVRSGAETIAKHIKSGELSIYTFNAILCYFFFEIERLYENLEERILPLKNLKTFFKTIDVEYAKPEHIFYTNEFIALFFKKIKIIGIYPNVQPNFELVLSKYTNDGEYITIFDDKEVRDYKDILPSIKDILRYKELVKDEFKEFRVGFDGFPIPIDQIIELPFFRIDKRKEEQLDLLKDELNLILEKENKAKELIQEEIEFKDAIEKDFILKNQLRNEIKKIKAFFSKKHTPIEVLEKQNDIYISSPAGSGKTTTLKWFAYKLSSQGNQLPIFVELQSYKSDLKTLIEYSIKRFKLDFNSIRNHKNLILLIDGFDEYSGNDQDTLVREIRDFKKEFGCQIIFSGRYKPIGLGEKEFYTYKLSVFDDNDIQRIFNNVFPEKGTEYYNSLYKADLLESINIPLFLMFLIAHLKKQGEFKIKVITELLQNKGKLLKTVLIDDFLNEYEHKKYTKLREHQWLELKTKQIELISLFAYYLTFELINKENAHLQKDGIITFLKVHAVPIIRYESIDYEQLFIDFKEHSILSFKRDFVGFDKKEVRLFFTANYLKNQIHSNKDYSVFRKKFKGDENSWSSIETYLFGLIEPKKVMQEIKSFFIEDQIVYNNHFIFQIEYALKFIKSGNLDSNFKLLNKFYILNLIGLILFNDLKYTVNNKRRKNNHFKYSLFYIINESKYLIRTYLSSLIPDANHYYFHNIFNKPHVSIRSTYELSEILDKKIGNNSLFKDLKINPKFFKYKNYLLDKKPIPVDDINKTPNFIFSLLENLIFNPFFDDRINTINIVKGYESQLKYMRLYLSRFFELYAHSYLDFYFKTHSPTIFNLKTLYLYYKENRARILSNRILPETKEKIVHHFNELALHSKNKYRLVIMIYNAFDSILDSEIQIELLTSWRKKISEKSTSKNIKNTLVEVIFRHLKDEDVSLFISLLKSENQRIIQNTIFGLSLYIARNPDENNKYTSEIYEELQTLFNDEIKDIKITMLSAFQLYRVNPPKDFINDILKFADNEEVHYFAAILFFGRSKIKEAEPYLIKVINEENSNSPIVYDALTNLNYENFYKYNNDFFEQKRIKLSTQLKFFIFIGEPNILEYRFTFDLETYNNFVRIGGEDELQLLEEAYNIILKNKIIFKPSEKKAFEENIKYLKLKVEKLKQTDYYKNNILPKKKSSDASSEDLI